MTSAILSVVIVSYNTRDMTLQCLRALHIALNDMKAEIFVVDNASSDGSAEAIGRDFPNVNLLKNENNHGFGAANNQAIRLAQGEFVLLLNSDAFPAQSAIDRLIECARNQPRGAVFGPRLLNEDGSLQHSCYRFPSPIKSIWENLLLASTFPNHPIFGDYRNWPHDAQREVDFVIGACWLVRRTAIEEIGLFDEEFFLYSEETDWAKRFQKAGWKTFFVPEAEVTHLGGISGATQADRVFCEFHRGQERFMRKHYGQFGLTIYRLTTVMGACLRIILFETAGFLRPDSRSKCKSLVAQWKRILLWTIGKRGAGLRDF